MQAIVSIDQGTTTTKAVAVGTVSGEILAQAAVSTGISFPEPGRAEQSAQAIWESVVTVLEQVTADEQLQPIALAITNQRETVVAWSRRSGQALAPAIGWQDSRTTAECDMLTEHQVEIEQRTGLRLDPMFSASKISWLLKSLTHLGHSLTDICVGTIDSWLLFKLTGKHVIEVGNASRTLLMDIAGTSWDPWLLDIFGIDPQVMPEIQPSMSNFGKVTLGNKELRRSKYVGLPIVAVLADSHAALFGHMQEDATIAKCTYGTGSSVMVPAATSSVAGAVTTSVAWGTTTRAQYANEGNIVATGAALDWTARMLGAPEQLPGGQYLAQLAQTVESSDGVHLVPAFSGLGAPYWDRCAQGLLTGLSQGTTPAHIAHAAIDSVAHQVTDVIEAMEANGGSKITEVVADGGASASKFIMQRQADLLGRTVRVSAVAEASAYGAARAAAAFLELTAWEALNSSTQYHPNITTDHRLLLRKRWKQAVARSRF